MGCGQSSKDRKVVDGDAKEDKKIVEKKEEKPAVAKEAADVEKVEEKKAETKEAKVEVKTDTEPKEKEEVAPVVAEAKTTAPKVLIVYYSMYGHIEKMTESVAKGAKEAGAEVTIKRIPETLSEEVLKKMGAKDKLEEHKEATPDDLAQADAILFGIPTRFGMAAAQVKALLDQTGGLWQKGALMGKLAGVYVSTGTQNGGQETTMWTFLTQFVHHGMIFVPIGYSNEGLQNMNEPKGGSPYGAGCLAGPSGKRPPSALELEIAEHQGKYTAGIATKMLKNKQA
mmetsp:Transcript_8794/g.13130  ORF Transcript_8794/g.13130 Transcript_8794/m.13130 type:complete len:284 (-) Transcript_8794:107-958(-)